MRHINMRLYIWNGSFKIVLLKLTSQVFLCDTLYNTGGLVGFWTPQDTCNIDKIYQTLFNFSIETVLK